MSGMARVDLIRDLLARILSPSANDCPGKHPRARSARLARRGTDPGARGACTRDAVVSRFSREARAPSVGRGQRRDRFGYRSAKALERRALATTHRAALPNENLLKTELAVASRAAWQALEARHAPQTQ